MPCALDLGTRQRFFAACLDLGHTANLFFSVCFFFYRVLCTLAHSKCCVCRVSSIYRVFFGRHTVNNVFTVCSKYCTRQTEGHTVNTRFLIVRAIGTISRIHMPWRRSSSSSHGALNQGADAHGRW